MYYAAILQASWVIVKWAEHTRIPEPDHLHGEKWSKDAGVLESVHLKVTDSKSRLDKDITSHRSLCWRSYRDTFFIIIY